MEIVCNMQYMVQSILFLVHEIIMPDSLTINEKSITQQYSTINPGDTLPFGTI